METYIALVLIFGQKTVDNYCENAFWTPYNQNEEVVEVCTPVWERVYNLSK